MKEREPKNQKRGQKEQQIRRTLNKKTKSPRLTRFITDLIFEK